MEPVQVIAGVMNFLNLRIPPYVRIDFVQISFSHAPKSKRNPSSDFCYISLQPFLYVSVGMNSSVNSQRKFVVVEKLK